MRDRGERNHAAVGGLQIIISELIGVLPRLLLHLWNHLVGAARQTEIVDVTATEQGSQCIADIAHRQAELRGLVAIDLYLRLRLIEFQVVVEKQEHAAFQRILIKLFGDFIEALERLGRADHELHRKTVTARQRRWLERSDSRTGNATQILLQFRLDLIGCLFALVPGFHHHTGDGLARHIQLEYVIGFRISLDLVVDLFRIQQALIQRGVRCRARKRDDDTLIFLRRELALRADIKKINTAEYDQGEHHRDR